MTSGTPSPSDSPSLAQRPLLLPTETAAALSTVTSTLTPSVAYRPQQGLELATVPARRTETVRFEILDDEVGVSPTQRRKRDFPER